MARTGAQLTSSEIVTVETLDAIANNSVIYKNNSGVYTAVALGTSGKVLQSNGATSAPTFETVTAAVATSVTVANEATDTTCFLLFVTAATGDLAPKTNANLAFNSSTGVLTLTSANLITPTLGVATATSINGLTITSSTGTFTLTNAKTLSVTNSLTLSGTDGTTMTFPTTSATLARTDAANTFTGASTASAWVLTSPTITTSIVPTSNDGAALGSTSNQFSDLFLAEGGVINWDNGDCTLTQANNLLTLAGAELVLPSTGPTSTLSAGFRGIPQNSQSAAYTTVLADAGGHILHPTADNNARTFTIDSNANVAYPIGTAITFINQINTVTIAITSDTLTLQGAGTTGSRTLAANGTATAIKVASTAWIISGTGLT